MSFKTWHVHITGIVQGVGFRPYVYQLASELEIKGWVKNDRDGVHIKFSCEEKVANLFYSNIISNPPSRATIISSAITEIHTQKFATFQIIHNSDSTQSNIHLTPDFAICNQCQLELNDSANRRHEYPYITCSECGPRYSIIREMPYDRQNTTMKSFHMCHSCLGEYDNPSDRRHYLTCKL